MADNEERILIIKITSDPYTCGIGGICKDKVCLKTLCEMGILRQEAINKISFALMQNGVDESDCKELAGVALNALLGVEK